MLVDPTLRLCGSGRASKGFLWSRACYALVAPRAARFLRSGARRRWRSPIRSIHIAWGSGVAPDRVSDLGQQGLLSIRRIGGAGRHRAAMLWPPRCASQGFLRSGEWTGVELPEPRVAPHLLSVGRTKASGDPAHRLGRWASGLFGRSLQAVKGFVALGLFCDPTASPPVSGRAASLWAAAGFTCRLVGRGATKSPWQRFAAGFAVRVRSGILTCLSERPSSRRWV